jgi:hypothetical protein
LDTDLFFNEGMDEKAKKRIKSFVAGGKKLQLMFMKLNVAFKHFLTSKDVNDEKDLKEVYDHKVLREVV